jgi:hypothetical protein
MKNPDTRRTPRSGQEGFANNNLPSFSRTAPFRQQTKIVRRRPFRHPHYEDDLDAVDCWITLAGAAAVCLRHLADRGEAD